MLFFWDCDTILVKECDKMKFLILSLLTTISLFLDINNQLNLKSYFLLCPIILVILYFFYRKNYNKIIKNNLFLILSILLSLFMIIGNTFSYAGNFSLITKSFLHIIANIFVFIGYVILFCNVISLFYYFLKADFNIAKLKKIKELFDKHPFVFSFIVIISCYLIYMIAFYPAILSPDPSNQIKQFFHVKTKYIESVVLLDENVWITNHHPIFHTLLLGGCIKLGESILNFNFGLFIYTLIQTITLISTLSYTIYYMKKLNTPYFFRLIILIIYAVVPVFPFYAMSAVKDTFFSCFIILYVIQLFDIIRKKAYSNKQLVCLLIIIFMMILFRNNGIHVFLLSFPFVFLVLKKLWKKNLVILIITLLFSYCYSNIVLPAFKITDGSIREMLSIPFQQTARYVKYHEEDISLEEKEAIDKILVYDTLKDRYKANISDPVKEKFNKYATSEDLKKYFIAWSKGLFKQPVTYIEATVENTYGYFYPGDTNWYIYYKYDSRLKDSGFDYSYNNLSTLRIILSNYGRCYLHIPIIGLIVNIGFSCWVILSLLIYVLYEKKYRYLPVFAPLLTLILICVASPVNTYFRYAMPYIFTLPILICMVRFILKENK